MPGVRDFADPAAIRLPDGGQWARVQGIYSQMAYRWFRAGTLPVPTVRVDQRAVLVSLAASSGPAAWSYGLHARLSSYGQRADLGWQVARLAWWAAGVGGPVMRVGAEVGSGMNGPGARGRLLLRGNAFPVPAAPVVP
jgi:putative resolvase